MSLTSSCTSNPNSYNARIFLCSKWVTSTEERLLHRPKILVGLFFHSWSSMQACICVQLCIEMNGENGRRVQACLMRGGVSVTSEFVRAKKKTLSDKC
jgi:hypothetical protein